ncbi:MAG TPA: MotA/TolQ/ExbB proton channel family protein [Sphingobium sp.]|nr:MotA/TolQ/ExbB proton channel family protein [Sphingobium sp.]
MFIQLSAAAAPAASSNPYGLMEALEQGGVIAWSVFIVLVGMSVFSFFILFSKMIEQQKVINQGKKVRATFWRSATLKEGAAKLEKNSAYKQLADDGIAAAEQQSKLPDSVEAHDWVALALARSEAAINSKLNGGLAFLATVGAVSPFIGLFGTVIGIYRALIKIGASGQASIDAVAGPVGEALIMTALGLAVAVPAVLAYNWLQRRNKFIAENLNDFSANVLGNIVSDGGIRPTTPAAAPAAAAAKPAAAKA